MIHRLIHYIENDSAGGTLISIGLAYLATFNIDSIKIIDSLIIDLLKIAILVLAFITGLWTAKGAKFRYNKEVDNKVDELNGKSKSNS